MFAVRASCAASFFCTASFFAAVAASGHVSAGVAQSPLFPRTHAAGMLRLHLTGNASAAYRIVDVGSPNNIVDGSAPEAFNNTGQIVGYATVPTSGTTSKTDCAVWTGSRFVDVSAGAGYLACGVVSIRDASAASKAYVVTGTVNVPLKDTAIGFITSGTSASTALALTTFQGNSDSSIVAVNGAGYGYGVAWYAPPGGFSDNIPPFVYSGGKLSPMQPACTTARAGCLAFISNQFAACPFGKCWMTEGGAILAADVVTRDLALFTKGVVTPLPLSATSPVTPVAMNESRQIAYWNSDANGEYAAFYDAYKRTSTHLGTLAGTGCTTYQPISINKNTAILGQATGCANGVDRVWLWDPVHKMRDLAKLVPASKYPSISLVGINDAGWILAALYTAGGTTDWGYLEPVTP